MTEPLPDTEEPQVSEADRKKLQRFLDGHDKAIKAWIKDHPHYEPPIVFDKDGNPRWLSRRERRKMMRMK